MSLAELRPGTEYEARVHINCLNQTAPHVSVSFETGLYGEATSLRALRLGGLALGMTVAMFIGLWIYDELSFNKYHQN